MHRDTRDFATGIQTRDNCVVALRIYGQCLTVYVGGNTTHHVVAGGNNRNGFFDGIDVSKGAAQLTDPREPGFQHLLTEVIQLELHVIAVRAAAPALENLEHH